MDLLSVSASAVKARLFNVNVFNCAVFHSVKRIIAGLGDIVAREDVAAPLANDNLTDFNGFAFINLDTEALGEGIAS